MQGRLLVNKSSSNVAFCIMGQLITKPKAKVVKEDINQDYQTYGKEGELDYAVDHNEQYQPSDYDEMEETSEDYECSKVSVF